MEPSNERRRYNKTSVLIGWAHVQNHLCWWRWTQTGASILSCLVYQCYMTYRGLTRMAAILQTTFLMYFLQWKSNFDYGRFPINSNNVHPIILFWFYYGHIERVTLVIEKTCRQYSSSKPVNLHVSHKKIQNVSRFPTYTTTYDFVHLSHLYFFATL